GHVCAGCGREDKLYERGSCARCSLLRRADVLLAGPTGTVPAALTAVRDAISAAPNPRTALNWLRRGAGAPLLATVARGAVPHRDPARDGVSAGRYRAAGLARHRRCSPRRHPASAPRALAARRPAGAGPPRRRLPRLGGRVSRRPTAGADPTGQRQRPGDRRG